MLLSVLILITIGGLSAIWWRWLLSDKKSFYSFHFYKNNKDSISATTITEQPQSLSTDTPPPPATNSYAATTTTSTSTTTNTNISTTSQTQQQQQQQSQKETPILKSLPRTSLVASRIEQFSRRPSSPEATPPLRPTTPKASPQSQPATEIRIELDSKYSSTSSDGSAPLDTTKKAVKELINATIAEKNPDLCLRDCNLILLPSRLRDCFHLTKLDLSHNQLTSLPEYFFQNMTQLVSFNLSHNRFYDLPQKFHQLRNLRHLDISHNDFEYIPSSLLPKLGGSGLKTLNISHCALIVVPTSVFRFSELEELDVSHNMLMDLPFTLTTMKSLKRISINNNRLMRSTIRTVVKQLSDAGLLYESVSTNKDEYSATARLSTALVRIDSLDASNAPESTSSPSSPSLGPEAGLSPSEKRRIQTLCEILESERKYVNYLDVLYEVFYRRITGQDMERAPNASGPPGDDNRPKSNASKLLPHNVVPTDLFPYDLFTIMNFNRDLLSELEGRLTTREAETDTKEMKPTAALQKVLIGDIFIRRAPFFKLYITYIAGYDNAASTLERVQQKSPEFNELLTTLESNSRCEGLNLQSLLIMPIQRVMRYKLLLQNLVEVTPTSHPDYKNLVAAVEKMSNEAKSINDRIYENENRKRVIEIQKELRLSEDFVKSYRVFVMEADMKLLRSTASSFMPDFSTSDDNDGDNGSSNGVVGSSSRRPPQLPPALRVSSDGSSDDDDDERDDDDDDEGSTSGVTSPTTIMGDHQPKSVHAYLFNDVLVLRPNQSSSFFNLLPLIRGGEGGVLIYSLNGAKVLQKQQQQQQQHASDSAASAEDATMTLLMFLSDAPTTGHSRSSLASIFSSSAPSSPIPSDSVIAETTSSSNEGASAAAAITTSHLVALTAIAGNAASATAGGKLQRGVRARSANLHNNNNNDFVHSAGDALATTLSSSLLYELELQLSSEEEQQRWVTKIKELAQRLHKNYGVLERSKSF